MGEASKSKDTIIVAKKGFINNGKLILFNGIIQTLNNSNEFKNIQFEKTELSLLGLSTRTVKQPKIQETSSSTLLRCVLNQNNNLNLNKCTKNYGPIDSERKILAAFSSLENPANQCLSS